MYIVKEDQNWKFLRSSEVNYNFSKINGLMMTWGKTKDQDAFYSPYGPFIADIEISTVCSQGCAACYKSNTPKGKNMSFATFKKLFNVLPDTLTQIAFGIGDFEANKDLKKIFEYTREKGIIPNVTINGSDKISNDDLRWLVKTCGAVAVSVYNKEKAYKKIQKLGEYGLKQVNIHQILSQETQLQCFQIIQDKIQDPRLDKLNAIVFLSLKKVGRGKSMNIIDARSYKQIIDLALKNKISIGFDSCGAGKFLNYIKQNKPKEYSKYFQLSEPCESWLFSAYFNYKGEFVPCSFCEGEIEPIKVLEGKDFWNAPEADKWRKNMKKRYKKQQYDCPLYEV